MVRVVENDTKIANYSYILLLDFRILRSVAESGEKSVDEGVPVTGPITQRLRSKINCI